MTTHTHILTFEGALPADEMKRAAILAHPKVTETRSALEAAFKEAGAPHTATSKISRPKGPRKPKLAVAAE